MDHPVFDAQRYCSISSFYHTRRRNVKIVEKLMQRSRVILTDGQRGRTNEVRLIRSGKREFFPPRFIEE